VVVEAAEDFKEGVLFVGRQCVQCGIEVVVRAFDAALRLRSLQILQSARDLFGYSRCDMCRVESRLMLLTSP